MAPDRLRDEIEIQRLAAAYSHAVMRLDAVAAVYAEDGMLTAFHQDAIIGRAAISHALELTFAPSPFSRKGKARRSSMSKATVRARPGQ